MLKNLLALLFALTLTVGTADARALHGGAVAHPENLLMGVNAGDDVTYNNGNSWVKSFNSSTGNDLAIDAGDNKHVSSATYKYTQADVGHPLLVSTNNGTVPTGFVMGLYMINSVDSDGSVHLATSPGTAGSTGGYFQYGISAEAQYMHDAGLIWIRSPFIWGTMQASLQGALNLAYMSDLLDIIRQASYLGMHVILDCHNYGAYEDFNVHILDPGGPSQADINDLWVKVDNYVKGWGVGLDLMNEPFNMTITWPQVAQGLINAIRANGDNASIIFIEGNGFSSAYQWINNGNDALKHITDPAGLDTNGRHKYIFEAHDYFDTDNSGSYLTVMNDSAPVNTNDGITNGTATITSVSSDFLNSAGSPPNPVVVGDKCVVNGGSGGSSAITAALYTVQSVTTHTVTLTSSSGLTANSNVHVECGGYAVRHGCQLADTTYTCATTLGDALDPGQPINAMTGVKRATVFVNWLKTNGLSGYGMIGETGWPYDDPRWNTAGNNHVQFLQDNNLIFTYWNGSNWSQCNASATQGILTNCSYRFGIFPTNVSTQPIDDVPMAVLKKFTGAPSPSHYQIYATGSQRGSPGAPSSPYQVVYNGYIKKSFTWTFNDRGAGGSFNPATIACASGFNCAGQTVYTPPSTPAVYLIGVTSDNSSLIDPTPIVYATVQDIVTKAGLTDAQVGNDLTFVKEDAIYNGPCADLVQANNTAYREFSYNGIQLGSVCDPAAIFAWNGVTESDLVPNNGNVTVQSPLTFGSDVSVAYSNGTLLKNVLRTEPPGTYGFLAFNTPILAAGEYYVSQLGFYVFSKADAGQTLTIKYLQPTFLERWFDNSGHGHDGHDVAQESSGNPPNVIYYPSPYGPANRPQFQLACTKAGTPCVYFSGSSFMDMDFFVGSQTGFQSDLSTSITFAPGTMDLMPYGAQGFQSFAPPTAGRDSGVSVLNADVMEFGWSSDTIVDPWHNPLNELGSAGGNWGVLYSNGQWRYNINNDSNNVASGYGSLGGFNIQAWSVDGDFHVMSTTFHDNVTSGANSFVDGLLVDHSDTTENSFTASISGNVLTTPSGNLDYQLGPYQGVGCADCVPGTIILRVLSFDATTGAGTFLVSASQNVSSETMHSTTYFSNTVSYSCSGNCDVHGNFTNSTPVSNYASIGRSAAHIGYSRIVFGPNQPKSFVGYVAGIFTANAAPATTAGFSALGAQQAANIGLGTPDPENYSATLNQNTTGTNTLPWMGSNDLFPQNQDPNQAAYVANHLKNNALRAQIHWGPNDFGQGAMVNEADTTLNSGYFGGSNGLDAYVSLHASHGVTVILDNHDGLCFRGGGCVNGANGASDATAHFEEFWHLMSVHYAGAPNVAFDLGNEPANSAWTASGLQTVYGTIISDARTSGFHGWIQLEFGPSFSGCNTYGGDTSMQGIFLTLLSGDPDHKLMLHCHNYFDDTNGGYQTNSSICAEGRATSDLSPLTAWAKNNNVILFYGEFGIGKSQTCFEEAKVALDDIIGGNLATVTLSGNVATTTAGGWGGFTAYGGGVNGWPKQYYFRHFPYPLNATTFDGPDDPEALFLKSIATGHSWPCADGTTGHSCGTNHWPRDLEFPLRYQ